MTATTIALEDILNATPLASKDEDEQAWHDDRAEGVTASEAGRISPSSRRSILDDKLNGAKFTGNAATEDGHRFEPFILTDLAEQRGTTIVANARVWAHEHDRRWMATPDAIEIDGDVVRGVEVKTHQHGWKMPSRVIPADHYDQMQWGMFVLGLDEWLYGWAVLDADGEFPFDPCPYRIVERDADRIHELATAAVGFMDWIDQGAPADELSDALAADRDALVAADAAVKAATEAHAAARKRFEQRLRDESPSAFVSGWSHLGDDGISVTVARPSRRVSLDEKAWEAAEPDDYAEWSQVGMRAAELESSARDRFQTVKYSAPALRITKAKGKA